MNRRALSQIEVVVTGALLMVLALILANIYSLSLDSLQEGAERSQAEKRIRLAFERIRPLLASAVAPYPGQDAIYAPAPGTHAPQLTFCSSQGWTGEARNPALLRIGLQGRALQLEEVAPPRRRRILGQGMDQVRFDRVDLNSVQVTVVVHSEIQGTRRRLEVDTPVQSLFPIPFYTAD